MVRIDDLDPKLYVIMNENYLEKLLIHLFGSRLKFSDI